MILTGTLSVTKPTCTTRPASVLAPVDCSLSWWPCLSYNTIHAGQLCQSSLVHNLPKLSHFRLNCDVKGPVHFFSKKLLRHSFLKYCSKLELKVANWLYGRGLEIKTGSRSVDDLGEQKKINLCTLLWCPLIYNVTAVDCISPGDHVSR